MRNYITDAFARMDLQQIREFILNGVECCNPEHKPYNIRLKEGSSAIYKRLESIYPNEDAREKIDADLSQALGTYESVYTEIGMKAGAKIIYQLLVAEQ